MLRIVFSKKKKIKKKTLKVKLMRFVMDLLTYPFLNLQQLHINNKLETLEAKQINQYNNNLCS